MSTSFRNSPYAFSRSGNILNNIPARIFCCPFHFDLCLSMICWLHAIIWGMVSPFSILSGSHCPISSRSSFKAAFFRLRRCSLIALFSASSTSQRWRIFSWSTASGMSRWTWNRSLTSDAPVDLSSHLRFRTCRYVARPYGIILYSPVITKAVGDYVFIVLVFAKLFILLIKPNVETAIAFFKAVNVEVVYQDFGEDGSE